jgi:hypothetical protein
MRLPLTRRERAATGFGCRTGNCARAARPGRAGAGAASARVAGRAGPRTRAASAADGHAGSAASRPASTSHAAGGAASAEPNVHASGVLRAAAGGSPTNGAGATCRDIPAGPAASAANPDAPASSSWRRTPSRLAAAQAGSRRTASTPRATRAATAARTGWTIRLGIRFTGCAETEEAQDGVFLVLHGVGAVSSRPGLENRRSASVLPELAIIGGDRSGLTIR